MSALPPADKMRRESLMLLDHTWKAYDKYYSQLAKYLDETGQTVSETSLLAWVLHLKESGSAASTINKIFAAIVTVLECKIGEQPKGVKFIKTRIKRWLNKSVPKKSLSFRYAEVVDILSSCDLSSLREVVMCTSLILGVFGLHRISEIKAYTSTMVRRDEEGRGYWCESSVGSKTTAVGQLTRFHVPCEMKHHDKVARPTKILEEHLKALRNKYGSNYNGKIFKTVRNGVFIDMSIGINTLRSYPMFLAEKLGRKDARQFTGHAYRRTGARVLADMGATKREIQRAGRWKDPNICEGYIDESDLTAINTSNLMSGKARMTSVLEAATTTPKVSAAKKSSCLMASTSLSAPFKPPRKLTE